MTRSYRKEIVIDASVEDVYRALTEAEELVRWFPLEAGKDDDGTLWMSWGGQTRFSGRADALEPPRRAKFVYPMPPPGRDPASLEPEDFVEIATEYTLESDGGKTTLTLTHSGFGDGTEWDDLFDATRAGWEFELRGLRHYLEHHRGEDRAVAWAKAPFEGSRDEAWKKLMGAEGFAANGALGSSPSEGSSYRMTAATGDAFDGKLLFVEPPASFVATTESFNHAFLRVKLEELYGAREAHVFLSAYGVPPSEVRSFEVRWQERLNALFNA